MLLKHQRVAATLATEIRTGRVGPGAQLPGENALAQRFRVSRTTVRSALAELCAAGLIATHTGKGSYVVFDGRPMDMRRGWAKAFAAQGVDARARVVRIARVDDRGLARRLRLPSTDVVVVERVRELPGGDVVSYERSTVPTVDGLADLPEGDLVDGSLVTTLRRAGLVADHAEQRVRARPINGREARLLRRPAGVWFLFVTRTIWTADGAFVEHAESLLDPAHFELRVDIGEPAR